MAISMQNLLDRMAAGETPSRRLEGGNAIWRVGPQGDACGPAVRAALKHGYATGHFPTGQGFLHLTDDGKAQARRANPDA